MGAAEPTAIRTKASWEVGTRVWRVESPQPSHTAANKNRRARQKNLRMKGLLGDDDLMPAERSGGTRGAAGSLRRESFVQASVCGPQTDHLHLHVLRIHPGDAESDRYCKGK